MPSQYRAVWSVPGGGTGYSVFHADNASDQTDADELADAIHDFFDSIDPLIPDDVTISFDSEVLVLADDGTLTNVWAVTPPSSVAGSGTAVYARAQGARVDWSTGTIVAGHRLSGRTYLVPIIGTAFDTAGLLLSSTVTTLQAAADGLIAQLTTAGVVLKVWSRTHATTGVVVSASIPDKGAVLRSRRD